VKTTYTENKGGHMRARMKRISRSKLQRRPRPAGVELGVVGVAVGAGCGMLGGLMIEFNSRPSALVMFVGALIGHDGRRIGRARPIPGAQTRTPKNRTP
jgi:hypothetical protein